MAHTPLIRELRRCLGPENVLSAPSELSVYDADGLTILREAPEAVVFPRSTEHVVAALAACRRHGAAVIARGAGTGLAGGCTPSRGGVVLSLARMNRILGVHLRDRMAVVEPGVVNLQLSRAVAAAGHHFAPTPPAKARPRSAATSPRTPADRTRSATA